MLTTKMMRSIKDNTYVFSPWSIEAVLRCCLIGSAGRTETQLKAALGDVQFHTRFPSNGATINTEVFAVADSVYKFLDRYKQAIQESLQCTVENRNFRDAERVRSDINSRVNRATRNLIKDILPSHLPNETTKMLLVSALYFFGEWAYPFDVNKTTEMPFRAGNSSYVTMMQSSFNYIPYYEDDLFQVAFLPYLGGSSFILALPRNVGNVPNITEDMLGNWFNKRTNIGVKVSMPKFTSRFCKIKDVIPLLTDIGITDLFSHSANLSKMDGTNNLFVSDVLHDAIIIVDEFKTEGAAATVAAVAMKGIMNVREMKADHPFAYFVVEENTSEILLAGKFSN